VDPGADLKILLSKEGGPNAVALWMYPMSSEEASHIRIVPLPVRDGYGPQIGLMPDDLKVAYRDEYVRIMEIPGVRKYMTAESCDIKMVSWDEAYSTCAKPTKMTRLELFMEGWSATVNGAAVHLDLSEDVFQTIDLPAGGSHLVFTYRPKFFGASMGISISTLLLILVALVASTVTSGGKNCLRLAARKTMA
jgi:hypothetical protein